MSKQLQPINEVRGTLEKMAPQFKMALPAHVSTDKFMRVVMTALQNAPKLLEVDRASLYSACMKAAQDGLLPDGREGAIIPRRNKAAWNPMVAGVMKKVRNSGEISTWSVHCVREHDFFDFQLGDDEKITHTVNHRGNRGNLIGAYSIVRMKDGELSREFMPIDEIYKIRDRSEGYKYQVSKGGTDNPWFTDEAEMFKKTVIHRHSKRLPMNTDIDGMLHDNDSDNEDIGRDITPPPAEQKQRPSVYEAVIEQAKATESADTATGEVIPGTSDESPI